MELPWCGWLLWQTAMQKQSWKKGVKFRGKKRFALIWSLKPVLYILVSLCSSVHLLRMLVPLIARIRPNVRAEKRMRERNRWSLLTVFEMERERTVGREQISEVTFLLLFD